MTRKAKDEIVAGIKGDVISIRGQRGRMSHVVVPRKNHAYDEMAVIIAKTKLGRELLEEHGTLASVINRLAARQLRHHFIAAQRTKTVKTSMSKLVKAMTPAMKRRLRKIAKSLPPLGGFGNREGKEVE